MAKITKLRELLKLMVIKEVNSMASSGMIGTSPDIIQTPGAFTGNKPSREEKRKKNGEVSGLKRAEILRKDFVTEGKFKDALFEDVINKVTFGMKLSDQAKELMDFVRGSKQHAEELGQIGELLKGMGDSGDTTNQQAFELYQEFLENAARDFVRLNASDMKPEEYFLKKDLLQLTYYFTQKFATPMTQGPDAIDKEPGQEPEAGMPPEDGEGGDDGGGGGSMGGGGGSMPPTDGAEEIPQPGEEGEEAPPEGGEGEIPPEGGEGEVPPEGEEEDPRKPPKPENVKETWDSSKYQHNQMMKKARKNADPKRAYKQYLTQLNKNVKPKSYDEWYAQWNVGRQDESKKKLEEEVYKGFAIKYWPVGSQHWKATWHGVSMNHKDKDALKRMIDQRVADAHRERRVARGDFGDSLTGGK